MGANRGWSKCRREGKREERKRAWSCWLGRQTCGKSPRRLLLQLRITVFTSTLVTPFSLFLFVLDWTWIQPESKLELTRPLRQQRRWGFRCCCPSRDGRWLLNRNRSCSSCWRNLLVTSPAADLRLKHARSRPIYPSNFYAKPEEHRAREREERRLKSCCCCRYENRSAGERGKKAPYYKKEREGKGGTREKRPVYFYECCRSLNQKKGEQRPSLTIISWLLLSPSRTILDSSMCMYIFYVSISHILVYSNIYVCIYVYRKLGSWLFLLFFPSSFFRWLLLPAFFLVAEVACSSQWT